MKVRTRRERKERKHLRVRSKVVGTATRPRLCVNRTLKHCHAQIIDDDAGITLVSASTLEESLRSEVAHTGNAKAAASVGSLIARRAQEKGIKQVVFDRGGNQYHGRVKHLADAAREAGLVF